MLVDKQSLLRLNYMTWVRWAKALADKSGHLDLLMEEENGLLHIVLWVCVYSVTYEHMIK